MAAEFGLELGPTEMERRFIVTIALSDLNRAIAQFPDGFMAILRLSLSCQLLVDGL